MPSPRRPWLWLLHKEWRGLMASPAWWIMLVLTGPLVGFAFMSAVHTYAELSGLDGTAAGAGPAFSPLVGIWAPTFSAYELIAAFLLPFVVIRAVAADRQTGAAKLELQQPLSPLARIGLKAVVVFAGWLIASLGAVAAFVLWKTYGGASHAPELATIVFGHLLNAAFTIALGSAAASLTEHPATAAILTLGFTVGTWIVNFAGAVQGGWWERLAGYTPPAAIAAFQHGLLRLDLILVGLACVAAGLGIAAVWMRVGVTVGRRALESAAVAGLAAMVAFASGFARASWDESEARYNSFSPGEEEALRAIRAPVVIEVHLAAEDPRRFDLERQALSKLRRVLPALEVRYVASTTTGLFEQTSPNYGEIRYEIAGRQAVSRSTSAEAVLETIWSLAGVTPPADSDDELFRGHPLAVPPTGAAAAFYVVWPAAALGAAYVTLGRQA